MQLTLIARDAAVVDAAHAVVLPADVALVRYPTFAEAVTADAIAGAALVLFDRAAIGDAALVNRAAAAPLAGVDTDRAAYVYAVDADGFNTSSTARDTLADMAAVGVQYLVRLPDGADWLGDRLTRPQAA